MAIISRHKAAIHRKELSKPVRLAMESGLLLEGTTVLDFGCGHGDDVRLLREQGYQAVGWDPFFRPDVNLQRKNLVNVGFVLNVIEQPAERIATLKKAWALAAETLIVGVLVQGDAKGSAVPFADGVVTSIGTFQKYFGHKEIESLIERVTGVPPVALGLGVFAAIRKPAQRTTMLAKRYRTGRTLSASGMQDLFQENAEALAPVISFVLTHARWPKVKDGVVVDTRLGSLGRAVKLAQHSFSDEAMLNAHEKVVEDLLVYIAMLILAGGGKMSDLDTLSQGDVRAHLGSYGKAKEQASRLLFSLGDPTVLRRAAKSASVGKTLPMAHYVHASALDELPPELRLFAMCAKRFVGGLEGANLLKLKLGSFAVSFLSYPDFDTAPHPVLAWSLTVDLRSFRLKRRDYTGRANPPILHRKELFVSPTYKGYAKFRRLTLQEEKWSLYDGTTGDIGTRNGWSMRLAAAGVQVKGHRVVRVKRPDVLGAVASNPAISES